MKKFLFTLDEKIKNILLAQHKISQIFFFSNYPYLVFL